MTPEVQTSVVATVREFCEETEQTRQLSPAVVDVLTRHRLNLIAVAESDHGLGMSLASMADLMHNMAYEDAAAAWVLWNASLVGFYSRYMSSDLKHDLFGSTTNMFCQSTMPIGEIDLDTHTVSGTWPLVSGCSRADWVILTCRVQQAGRAVINSDGSPDTRLVAIPMDQVEVLDTWHTNGLRGTGSHDVSVDSVEAPAHRVFSLAKTPNRQAPSDYLPIFASSSVLFAAQCLGLGQAVLDTSVQRVVNAPATSRTHALAESETFNLAVASHTGALNASNILLQAAIQRTDTSASQQTGPSRADIAALYSAAMQAIASVQRSTKQWSNIAGTSALYTTSPLEKRLRDLQAMERHIVAHPSFQADTGRVMLNKDPLWPLFLI